MSESDSRYTKKAEILADKKISVIGYDETGRAHAMNLRDFGLDIIIGVRPGKSWERASNDGFEVFSISDAVEVSDVVSVTLPAMTTPRVYEKFIKNNLTENKCLIFSYAACLNFKILDIPASLRTLTIFTPKTGENLRKEYLSGRKIRSYAAIYQNPDNICRSIAQEYATGIGSSDEHFFEVRMSEIACAQIFAGEHLSDFLEFVTKTAIEALNDEIACNELSHDMITEALFNASENAAWSKDQMILHPGKKSLSKDIFKTEFEEQISEWVYESESGMTFKKTLLSDL